MRAKREAKCRKKSQQGTMEIRVVHNSLCVSRYFSTHGTFISLDRNYKIIMKLKLIKHIFRLRNLYMKKALGRRSPKSKSELLSVLFSADHTNEFIDLTLIDLSENDIGIIHPETFCKVDFFSFFALKSSAFVE